MKKAIIVGASTGIGEGLARLLIENGYKVGITGRRAELLLPLKATQPDRFTVKVFDVQYEIIKEQNLTDSVK
jgi:NADP-dependent 3-hydroxy acid dehydrogenase YdfG